ARLAEPRRGRKTVLRGGTTRHGVRAILRTHLPASSHDSVGKIAAALTLRKVPRSRFCPPYGAVRARGSWDPARNSNETTKLVIPTAAHRVGGENRIHRFPAAQKRQRRSRRGS